MSIEKILVTSNEAAKMLSMGESTFFARVKDGTLPAPRKIGGLSRWNVKQLQQFFEATLTTNSSSPAA
jgi:excisionase family DNA binding protein